MTAGSVDIFPVAKDLRMSQAFLSQVGCGGEPSVDDDEVSAEGEGSVDGGGAAAGSEGGVTDGEGRIPACLQQLAMVSEVISCHACFAMSKASSKFIL